MSRMFHLTAALLSAAALLTACERPGNMDAKQVGYRGTGMVQITNPRIVGKDAALHVAPEAPAAASPDGPRAKEIYKNVQVLGDLSVGEFARTMVAITAWVAPTEGCAYCHNLQNLADDSKYTKVVARKMTQMTQHLNADWKPHVGATGVTCYTCHRGNNIPVNVWTNPAPNRMAMGMLGNDAGQNKAAASVKFASLPYDAFSAYLTDNTAISDIRVNGPTALPTGNRHSIKQAEHTYSLMTHMSSALGVNCTFCHNTHSFQSWDGPATRVTAWYGIRMAGDVNAHYISTLGDVFPANRKGPTGDVAKANCATCHQGVNKPLNGAQMAKDYPAMYPVVAPAPAASAPDAAASGVTAMTVAPATTQVAQR